MKIVYHNAFEQSDYAHDGASMPGRMDVIMRAFANTCNYQVVEPEPAPYADIALAHTPSYIRDVGKNGKLYQMASLSCGGAILAAQLAFQGEPSFACIRPPGHHASRSSSWGYCTFCNMGIALLKLKQAGLIENAFLLDFDAHTGDGNIDVLSDWKAAQILNPMAENGKGYLEDIAAYISNLKSIDIIAVSAGFDTYKKDVGGKLSTSDFYIIGTHLKRLSRRMGHGRRFAILEGGYYLPDLGTNAVAFCQGFED